MIVACKLPSGLDIGGFVLKPAMIGHEDHQAARAPGRERIAGYEITRGVPKDVWQRWRGENASSPIIGLLLVEGFEDGDEHSLNAFCWANREVRGWQQAPQDGSVTNFNRGMR